MLRRLLFLTISLLYLGARFVVFLARRVVRAGQPAECIVLYYHSVPANCRRSFARQLEILTELGVPLNPEFPPELVGGTRYLGVTFDDAFEDAVKNAAPELVQRKIPAIFFVTTGALCRAASWWPENAPERERQIATADQLKDLPVDLISIGAHTISHPRLSHISEPQAKHEISQPRYSLKHLLSRDVDTFSFPYGDVNEDLVAFCRDAGYKRVFTSEHKQAFREPTAFVVGRVKVEPTDWELEFRTKVLGGYSWTPWASQIKRRILRAVGYRHGDALRYGSRIDN